MLRFLNMMILVYFSQIYLCCYILLLNLQTSLNCFFFLKKLLINYCIKDVRANCFCAFLLRTQIHMPGS